MNSANCGLVIDINIAKTMINRDKKGKSNNEDNSKWGDCTINIVLHVLVHLITDAGVGLWPLRVISTQSSCEFNIV